MDTFRLLRKTPLFSGLEDEAVMALASRARLSRYEPGERVISRSDETQAFFVVLSGRAKIFRSTPDGKEQILYLVEAGQPFCFCSAFTDRPYPVDVAALEKSLVAGIPSEDMEDLARRQPILLLKIMQTLAGRLLETMNLVESLALHGTQKRIACFLQHSEGCCAARPGDPFSLHISHTEMARIVGTSPETLSRVIQKFKRRRLIEASGRNIRILDHDGLAAAHETE
ncbi:transcriptional regulator, Crp/Fnr family [Pseudodesulfovibrio mercurii]|uniref:Transcriptional regulator, Crp/Fnr family n=1 Tax=Pseudodesulfovibrio mercurii TaxID=641491 RepID=F0JK46_9BACT|nr:Crp/Fnr family transcriptional regulator [Pseudodesulfovibrio mercurii]EGB16295.1 transcriptional regulator, Crp/Fnr family [Pseudodesulfovibrio mercurii]